MAKLKPNIVRGGTAIDLGNNLYLMRGRKHSSGGIDIGKNPRTGLEVEGDEVVQTSPSGLRVFSAQPILGGISPAQYILGGANPNDVFSAQEKWKKINRVRDDGKRYKIGGKKVDEKTFTTKLTKKQEGKFQNWYKNVSYELGLDSNPDNPLHAYDYRGFWLENRNKNIDYKQPDFHFTDTYKKPDHPTFSVESKYADKKYGIDPKTVGHWDGENFISGSFNDLIAARTDRPTKQLEYSNQPYEPSKEIIDYIKSTEGFRDKWYQDGKGIWTVGYGFTGSKVKKLFPNGMTREQADKYFTDSLNVRKQILQRDTPNWDSLNQNQRDALLSYHYNIGESNYRNSPKMQKGLEEKDWDTVSKNIDAGYNDKKNPGLRKRRDYERNLFNTPVEYKYGGIHIKSSKRGTFTAAAKRHGMGVQAFASKVLANKSNYSPVMVKKANFARNASKWKHKEFGGEESGVLVLQRKGRKISTINDIPKIEKGKYLNQQSKDYFSQFKDYNDYLANNKLNADERNWSDKQADYYYNNSGLYKEYYDLIDTVSKYNKKRKEYESAFSVPTGNKSYKLKSVVDGKPTNKNLLNIDENILNYIYDESIKGNVDPKVAIALATNESNLGNSRNKDGKLNAFDLYSYWAGTGSVIYPNSKTTDLYNKLINKNPSELTEEDINIIRDLKDKYNYMNEHIHPYKGTNPTKDAVEYFLSGKYPGLAVPQERIDNYNKLVMSRFDELMNDNRFKTWYNNKSKRKFGGDMTYNYILGKNNIYKLGGKKAYGGPDNPPFGLLPNMTIDRGLYLDNHRIGIDSSIYGVDFKTPNSGIINPSIISVKRPDLVSESEIEPAIVTATRPDLVSNGGEILPSVVFGNRKEFVSNGGNITPAVVTVARNNSNTKPATKSSTNKVVKRNIYTNVKPIDITNNSEELSRRAIGYSDDDLSKMRNDIVSKYNTKVQSDLNDLKNINRESFETIPNPHEIKYTSSLIKPNGISYKEKQKILNRAKRQNAWNNIKGAISDPDIVSTLINVSGNLGSFLINRNAINKMKYYDILPLRANKMKTRFNINPQLASVREQIARGEEDTKHNTASSKTALNRRQYLRARGLDIVNQLYGQKENIETQLINRDKLNQQEVANRNIEARNQWRAGKSQFENNKREMKAENSVAFINNLTDAIAGQSGYLARRDRRKDNATKFERDLLNLDLFSKMYPNADPIVRDSIDKTISDFRNRYKRRYKNVNS